MRNRFGGAKVSDEMRHVCALIDGEMAQWPEVTVRAMFGFRAYYRQGVIFALLPETRALETPTSFAYKLPTDRAPEGAKWISWETDGPESAQAALALLDRAYTAAVQQKKHAKKMQ
ncbi:MAG: hypothetical protein ACJ71S_11745 [Acidobacteriaceae bacterium]